MKRLVCEMCGSSDLIKTEGVFECQSCGCKYTVEEARKMMVEVDGTVNVQGTVHVDNTENIEQYLKIAGDASKGGNYEECESYANKVLEIDTENAMAWFLKGNAMAWQSSLKNMRLNESLVAWKNALTHVDENVASDVAMSIRKTYEAVLVAIYTMYLRTLIHSLNPNDIQTVLLTIAGLQMNYIVKMGEFNKTLENRQIQCGTVFTEYDTVYVPYSSWSSIFSEQENSTLEAIARCKGFSTIPSTTMNKITIAANYYTLISMALEEDSRMAAYNKAVQAMNNIGTALVRSEFNGRAIANLGVGPIKKEQEEERIKIQKLQKERKQKRFEDYWNEHAEEKKALESEQEQLQNEKKELDAKLSEFKKKQESVPAMEDLNRIKTEINSLYDKQSKLGIFKGKEKKALQEQIDKLEDNKKGIEKTVKQQQYDLEPEIMPVKNRYKEVKERIDTIGRELKKER